jgi:2-polyprenyl-3-methyl-5-hydroxy-6-metoxy-1,4-benzoquinol methylase
MKIKGVSTREIVQLTNGILGTEFKNYLELSEKIVQVKARLHKQWLDSGCADYSVYDDPEYIYEAIHCFEKTKNCVGGVAKYFGGFQSYLAEAGQPDLTMLDVYNGNGLTTIHLVRNGLNVETFNTCEPQIEYMQQAARKLCGTKIKNYTKLPRKQYDVVMSFEVLEHCINPLEHLDELMQLIKPNGYLAESSGFNGSSENIGHFDTYMIEGQAVPFRAARRMTTRKIKEHFTLVFDGFNRMPKIWKRKSL